MGKRRTRVRPLVGYRVSPIDVEPAMDDSREQEIPEEGPPRQGSEESDSTFQEPLPALQQAQGQHPLGGENPLPGTTTVLAPELTEAVKKLAIGISESLATIVTTSLLPLNNRPGLHSLLLLSYLRTAVILAKRNNIEEEKLLALMKQLYQEAPLPNAQQ